MLIEGTLVHPEGEEYGQVEINPDSGIIEYVGQKKGDADHVFPDPLKILYAFVDSHVHFREDPFGNKNYKESFLTGSLAALQGGIAVAADQPNNDLPPIDDISYAGKEKLTELSLVDLILIAGIGPGTRPLTRHVPYKAFMCHSVGDLHFDNYTQLEKTLVNYGGKPITLHCEDPHILAEHEGAPYHEDRRPTIAEASAVTHAVTLARQLKFPVTFAHMSSAEGLAIARQAMREGLDARIEITPHHCTHDYERVGKGDRRYQMNPPLRARDDRMACLTFLRDADHVMLSTDHAPHTPEEKSRGVSGVVHHDTHGLFVSLLAQGDKDFPAIPWSRLAQITSATPGAYLSQFTHRQYGRIAPGYEGLLTVMNPDAPVRLKRRHLKSKAQDSIYLDKEFPGRPHCTIMRDQIYFQQFP